MEEAEAIGAGSDVSWIDARQGIALYNGFVNHEGKIQWRTYRRLLANCHAAFLKGRKERRKYENYRAACLRAHAHAEKGKLKE